MTLATIFALYFCVITTCLSCSCSNSAPPPNFLIPQWQWEVQQPRFPLVPIDRNMQNVWFPLVRPQGQIPVRVQQERPQLLPAFDGLNRRECRVKCPCPYDFNQLCGSNGLTYDNTCELECQKSCYPDLRIFKKGPCE